MSQRFKILLMLIGGVFYSAYMSAQDKQLGWKDFTYISQSEGWLSSYNAAGLKHLPASISMANIYADKKEGKFINYYESDNSLNLGANVESYYRLNPKIVFYGKVSYDNFKGKNMGGSVFIDPYYNPFDIVEFADSTRGKKNLEFYHLVGAVSTYLSKGFTIGARFDYKTANYAKTKDLRHTNKLMDMYVTAGLSYEVNQKIELGLNYYYRRSTEDMSFNTYGTTDQRYESLIDYGGFFGKTEVFGETGYTSSKNGGESPMFNQFNGVAFQLNYRLSPKISLFNEIAYKSRDGYYGVKGSSKILYSKHNSDIVEYKGVFSYSNKNYKHILNVGINNEELENYETVYRTENQGGGTSITVYYDPLKVLKRSIFNGKLEYTGNFGIEDFNPVWILNAVVEYYKKDQTAYLYPFYRKQTIKRTTINLSAKRNIIKGSNMYTFMLGATYATGSGMPKGDGLYTPPSESQITPRTIDKDLYREYEYLTNNQWKGAAGFQYSRLFNGIKGYALVNYSLTKASDIEYLEGSTRNQVCVTVGCTF